MSHSEVAIRTTGLTKRFGDLVAVNGLDLEVPAGICQGLLGPNGAGKTTTINILVGLDRADSGEAVIYGRDWATDASEIREQIGVQLQESELFEKLTVGEILRLFQSFYRDGPPIDEIVELVGMTEKRDARFRTLSGGQKQRLSLGCALVNRPRLLFLDEPTTGLDPQARRRVWEIVSDFKSRGGTVLLTTHYMDEAEQLCDHIVIVDRGQSIAEGSPREIIDSLGAESLIEFSADGDVRAEQLEKLPGVLQVRTEGTLTTLHVEQAHQALPALLDHVRSAGIPFDDLRTHRPTLEDVFVSLTGRHLRDE